MADERVGDKEKYDAAVSLIGVSESTSISRFTTFLAIAAVLAAGWVQLLLQQPKP